MKRSQQVAKKCENINLILIAEEHTTLKNEINI